MASQRRVKVFGIVTFLIVVTIYLWTSSLRRQQSDDFYFRTVQALDQRPELLEPLEPKSEDAKEVTRLMSERLNEAARVAKSNANAKAPKPDTPRNPVGVGNAADARREGRKHPPQGSQEQTREETEEDHEIEAELNIILKRSPIIIFSKSYCPHSRRAKDILLQKYIIDPAPFVVELDQHPLGLSLQARLAELTGRRTVPNVLINGVSIGGGDDVADLDDRGNLVQKVRELGGKRMAEVRQRPGNADDHGLR